MVTLLVLDVAAILSLLAGGLEVHANSSLVREDPPYAFAPGFTQLHSQNAALSGPVSEWVHFSFLTYLFNKLFYATKTFEVVRELSVFVHLFLLGNKYAWGPFFLALLYRCMEIFVTQFKESDHYSRVDGPVWFVQLWVKLYFPNLTPDLDTKTHRVLGTALAIVPSLPLDRGGGLEVISGS